MVGDFYTLTRAFAISGKGRLVPIFSDYRLGAVAIVIQTRTEGEELIAANAGAWIDEPRLVRNWPGV